MWIDWTILWCGLAEPFDDVEVTGISRAPVVYGYWAIWWCVVTGLYGVTGLSDVSGLWDDVWLLGYLT